MARVAVDWRQLVAAYDWPVDDALRVIKGPTPPNAQAPDGCATGESGGNATEISATGDYGLMGIHYAAHVDKLIRVAGAPDPTLLLDPRVNIAVGYLVWRDSGGRSFAPWSCRP